MKLALTIHAEENALLFAGRPVHGCVASQALAEAGIPVLATNPELLEQ